MFDFAIMGIWCAGAVIVVGVMQWGKGFAAQTIQRVIPSWVWSLILPFCALGASAAFSFKQSGGSWIWNALGIWAVSQLGYEVIVKTVVENLLSGGKQRVRSDDTINNSVSEVKDAIAFSEAAHV